MTPNTQLVKMAFLNFLMSLIKLYKLQFINYFSAVDTFCEKRQTFKRLN